MSPQKSQQQKDKAYQLLAADHALQVQSTFSLAKTLAIFVLILSLIFASRIFLRQQDEFRRVRQRYEVVAQRYAEVQEKEKSIESQFRDITSEQQLELLAREELGFLRPGDIVYKDVR